MSTNAVLARSHTKQCIKWVNPRRNIEIVRIIAFTRQPANNHQPWSIAIFAHWHFVSLRQRSFSNARCIQNVVCLEKVCESCFVPLFNADCANMRDRVNNWPWRFLKWWKYGNVDAVCTVRCWKNPNRKRIEEKTKYFTKWLQMFIAYFKMST